MAGEFEIKIDTTELERLAVPLGPEGARIVAKETRLALLATLETDAKGRLLKTLPIGVTGNLRNGLTVEIEPKETGAMPTGGRLFPSARYAEWVEVGRGPGGVDEASLMPWIRRKGLTEFAEQIIWSIRLHGTRRFRSGSTGEWAKVNELMPNFIASRMKDAESNVARQIEGGA